MNGRDKTGRLGYCNRYDRYLQVIHQGQYTGVMFGKRRRLKGNLVRQMVMNEFLINLEDKPGAMAECCEVLGEAGINILAGAGIASTIAAAVIVTDNAEATEEALNSIGVTFSMRPLETAVLHHSPGSLGVFTRSLAENGINLQSLFIMRTDGDDVHIGYSTA